MSDNIQMPGLNVSATFDPSGVSKGLTQVKAQVQQFGEWARKQGTIMLTAKLSGLDPLKAELGKSLSGFAAQVKTRLDAASLNAAVEALAKRFTNTSVQVKAVMEAASLTAAVAQLRARFTGGITFKATIDPASVTAALASLKTGVGANGIKTRVTFDQASITTAIGAFQSRLSGIGARVKIVFDPASVATAITTLRNSITAAGMPVKITFDPSTVSVAIAALRAQLSSVVGINTSAVTAVQAQVNTQITRVTALIAELRALGGGGGGGGGGAGGGGISAANRALLTQLDALNQSYKRGEISAGTYASRLTTLQTSLRAAGAAATAGSNEFKALDQAVTKTVNGLRGINSDKIAKLRGDLATAKVAFDAASAAATTLAQKQAATAAYVAEITRVKVALTGLGASGTLTAKQIDQVNRSLAQANKAQGQLGQSGSNGGFLQFLSQLTSGIPGIGQFTAGLTGAGAGVLGLTAALGLLTAAFGTSFKTAAEFQQVMADINALTQPTALELNNLRDAAINIGQPLGVGARDAAAAIRELNKAGLSAAEAIGGGLEGALNLAGAAGVKAAEGATYAVGAMTAFGLTAKDLPKVADVFANFANTTFLGAQDLSQALAAVGPVAKNAGLSLNEFAGYMATLAQGGFKQMSDAGTSLKTMLLALQSPSSLAAETMANLAVNVYDAGGALRPFADILTDLRGSLKGLTDQETNRALKDLFGQDAIRAGTILLGKSREEIQANIDAQGKYGEAARVSASRLETFQGAQAKMNASYEEFRIVLGEKLLPAATSLIKAFDGLIQNTTAMSNGTENLLGYIVPLSVALVALKLDFAAIAALTTTTTLASIGAAFSSLFGIITTFVAANPIGILMLALAAAATALNKFLGEINATYAAIDDTANKSNDRLLAQVRALKAEGTELAKAQAQLLLAQDRLSAAREGGMTGTDVWGNRTYEIDQEQIRKAEQAVAQYSAEVKKLNVEKKAVVEQPTVDPADTERIQKQGRVLQDLRKELAANDLQLKIGGLDGLDRDLAQIRSKFKKLGEDLKLAFGGNLNSRDYLTGLKDIEAAMGREIAVARATNSKKAAEKAVKDAADAAETSRSALNRAQSAEISAMKDGAAKRTAQRKQEIVELRQNVAKEVAELSKSATDRAQVLEAGRREEAALRKLWIREDQDRSADEAKKAATRAKRETEELAKELKKRTAEAKKQLEEEKKQREEARKEAEKAAQEERQANEAARSAQRDARGDTINGLQDGPQKVQAERDLALYDLRENLRKQLETVAGHEAAVAAVKAAGREKEAALRERWNQDDQKTARDHARALLELAAQQVRDRETLNQALRTRDAAALDLELARRAAAAKGNAVAEAEEEQKASQRRAALVERQAKERLASDKTLAAVTLNEALAAENLSAEARTAIWRAYYATVNKLDVDSQTEGLNRQKEREQAEKDSLERIRAARVAQALRPLETGADRLDELGFQQGLVKTASERLNYEVLITRQHARQEATIQGLLSGAAGVTLSTQERADLEKRLTTEQRAQVTGLQSVVSLQKESAAELKANSDRAQELALTYQSLGDAFSVQTGAAGASRDLTRATQGLTQAYAQLSPWLTRVRDGQITADEQQDAVKAMQNVISALEAQRQKLAALRSEYDRQRDSLSSIRDVLAGFGKELGSEAALNTAVQFNQQTYDAARKSLEVLLRGGQYDAAQLAQATSAFQAAYGKLKDGVAAIGDVQVSAVEKEKKKVAASFDAQIAVQQAALTRLQSAGADTSILDRNITRIQAEKQKAIDTLDAQAEAARKKSEDSLGTRTTGIEDVLLEVEKGAQKAASKVGNLGREFRQQEGDVAASAARMRDTLSGVFDSLPDVARQTGMSAVQQFAQGWEQGLGSLRLPGVTAGGRTASAPVTNTTNNNTSYSINGMEVRLSVNEEQLMRNLCARAARTQAQRNASGAAT